MKKVPHEVNIAPALLKQVMKAAGIMRGGGIAAYPTDTVYGLGADIFDDRAVSKVFAVKQRPLSMPLPILISETSQLAGLVEDIPSRAKVLMDKFWPGGLTIIFRKSPAFKSLALSGSDKVAVRLPGHPVTLSLILALGHPIVGTSANLHKSPAALTAEQVEQQLGRTVDFIVDGGPCPGGIESTIVDVTVNPPVIVRTGAVPVKDLASCFT